MTTRNGPSGAGSQFGPTKSVMANNALYFPYIDLPQNRFTNTALLYWDKIFTIAPWHTEFELKPENQNDLLIREGAIRQSRRRVWSHLRTLNSCPRRQDRGLCIGKG